MDNLMVLSDVNRFGDMPFKWSQVDEENQGFFENLFERVSVDRDLADTKRTRLDKKSTSPEQPATSFASMASDFLGLLQSSKTTDYIQEIVQKAQQSQQDDKALEELNTFPALVDMFSQYSSQLEQVADKFLGNIDLSDPPLPTALLYYLEKEDEAKACVGRYRS